MKKLMMSLLCIAMIVCFMPTMAWAAELGTNVSDADELKTALVKGGTVNLTANIDI